MDKAQFQSYCIDFDSSKYGAGLPPGINLSHTFVTSPNFDFNCFGRGKGNEGIARLLQGGSGSAFEQWAREIYGPYFGEQYQDQQYPAAGLHAHYDGICHNAANRILVLAGADVSDATGNALVMLMYGKYGFGVPQYIQSVKDAATKVNAEVQNTVISQTDIDAVILRIAGDAAAEIDTLEKELSKSHFEEQLNLQNLTADEANNVRAIYSSFQEKREGIFESTTAQNPSDLTNIQTQYGDAMKPELLQCLEQILEVLGQTKYITMFKAFPEQAVPFLLG